VTRRRLDLIVAACFCAAIGLYDVLYLLLGLSGGPLIGPSLNVLFPDFLVFHAAVRAWLAGKAALIYDIDAFTAFQNAIYADRFPKAVHFRPFFYPPIWLLLLLPLGALAVGKAYGLFMTATATLATALEGRRDWWGWLAILVSPAAVWTIVAGQNTFLSLGLFYGGLRLIERAPAAGGVLLGVLSYKPQIWALVPLALVAARQWRALGWMIATVAVLSLVSLGLFGLDFWLAFLDAAREASSPRVVNETFERIFMQMTTLLAAARIFGLPPAVSSAVQLAGAALAVAAVWIAFRRHPAGEARIAILATATFLVSPYTLNYDLLLLMPAVVVLFRLGASLGFYPFERLVHLALWLMPTLGWILNQLGLPLMPLVVLLFGAIAWARLKGRSKVELPGLATAS
jgi:alpha-1,2-mannosyltransferase